MTDPATFAWFPFLAVGWVILAIAASVVLRRRRGKPIVPRTPPNALFSERGCSGRSLDTPWGRIGGARNCLMVVLTPERLVITPMFPFTLLFLPEIYGLDHDLDISAIREVVDHTGLLGQRITLTYAGLRLRRVELRLRHPDAFLDGLRKLRVSVSQG
ncbi:hypothetical protein J2W22_004259 [Sphingomonas kyeonggiensis]|uniref:hypothetical protein n=1 Tax=Sphingomonas kyeonggiensis TaxID=1268553 RepID=UPI0027869427|nr:hypothetical protein [Sphingomonas kyeonggiensis]MDQ0252171.1 hypothetical protein [Sphingomonas kyeonggiensis]